MFRVTVSREVSRVSPHETKLDARARVFESVRLSVTRERIMFLDERGPSSSHSSRSSSSPSSFERNDDEEESMDVKRRNPQDKSHLAFHDERYACRKCARSASCFAVHRATQRIITIGKKKSLNYSSSGGGGFGERRRASSSRG